MSAHEEIVQTAAESLEQLDGFGPWCVISSRRFSALALGHRDEYALVYFEASIGGEWSTQYLAAERLADPDRPVFDPGAAADRAREAAIDRQNGVD